MAVHHITGKDGEKVAREFLLEKGYEVLEQNYRYKRAEIDLIARKGDVIIFVEVKTRTKKSFELPEDSITLKKQRLMAITASEYLYQKGLDMEIRFDIISIIMTDRPVEIMHFEDAFFPVD